MDRCYVKTKETARGNNYDFILIRQRITGNSFAISGIKNYEFVNFLRIIFLHLTTAAGG